MRTKMNCKIHFLIKQNVLHIYPTENLGYITDEIHKNYLEY